MFSLVNICFPKIYTLMDTFIVSCWILKNYFEQSFPCSRYEIISALSRDQIRISYCQFGIRAMRITVRCNLLSRKNLLTIILKNSVIPSRLSRSVYGSCPRVIISQTNTPNDHTSLFNENV